VAEEEIEADEKPVEQFKDYLAEVLGISYEDV